MLKTVVLLNIYVETGNIIWLIYSSKETFIWNMHAE